MKTSNTSILVWIMAAATSFPSSCVVQAWTVPRISLLFSRSNNKKAGIVDSSSTTTTTTIQKSRCPFPKLAKLGASVSSDTTSKPFLLDRLGGEAALTAAVDGLYTRLIKDPELKKYFDDMDMSLDDLKQHQFDFMKLAFTEIPGDVDIVKILIDGHARLWELGLDESHFDAVAGHLVETMQSLGVQQEEIDEAVGIVGPLRGIFEKGMN